MKFDPKTEKEVSAFGLLDEGVYSFQVSDAHEKISKKGNEMLELKLTIWDNNGKERPLFDYLLASFPHKLRHFADVTGLMDKYEKGSINSTDCIGKTGKAEIIIEEGSMKEDGTRYPNKNSIKDYVKSNGVVMAKKEEEPFLDDDLPF